MRRNDTTDIGDQAEQLAATLLRERGFEVTNLNDVRANNPLYDLRAKKDGHTIQISVKCARAKRELRLGRPRMLRQLADDGVVMAFLPIAKGRDIDLTPGGYELWIIPGAAARDDALAAHDHYARSHPGSADHSVMVKDKLDRTPDTRSGAVFHRWRDLYRDAWHVLDDVLA